MAFPTVQDADTQSGTVTSNAATWTLTYPTNLAVDDLILAFVASDGTVNWTSGWPAGWVFQSASGSATSLCWGKKKSDGTETGTFSITNSGSEQGAWRVFRISEWEGTLGTTTAGFSSTDGAVCASSIPGFSNGTDANPNPPVCDPFVWDTADTLHFAVTSIDTSRTISVYPLPDRNTADVSGGSTGATLGVCSVNTASQGTLDPGTFTISLSDDWEANTIAILNGTAGGGAPVLQPRHGFVNFNDPGVC